MDNGITIQSHKGPYRVVFGAPFAGLEKGLQKNEHLLIDAKVAELYKEILGPALQGASVLKIAATEKNKSLERIPDYVTFLSEHGVKRGHTLIAVGGGIIQDTAAFIAAVLFRGISWRFYPTTLLAQADSCIGSKSSINVGQYKNQVGTFTPPQDIHLSTEVLETLEEADFRSGIGEILKVHLIAGWEDFRPLAADYDGLKKDKTRLMTAIRRSLEIKKAIIEKDEFDLKERLILNYGHSFGHAIESATQYGVPHGLAITIGMDMANFVSWRLGLIDEKVFAEIHPVLRKNYRGFESSKIPEDSFFSALSKDKKNVENDLSLVLMRGPGNIFRDRYPNDEKFRSICQEYFKNIL
ncbi:MAG: 3-dehydroquinate synthase [Deltaproteobacteria bacterium]|nr:3-dehydroquinate synthase [Deltaproteobacteria bacterium]